MKALQWLLKLAVSAAVTSVCCVALTFVTVNTYVNMLLDQYHIERPAGQQLDWNQFVSGMTRQLGAMTGFSGGSKGPGKAAIGTGAETGSGFGSSSGTGTVKSSGSGKDLAVSGLALKDSGKDPTAVPSSPSGGSTTPSGTPNTGTDAGRKPPEDAVAVMGRQSVSGTDAPNDDRKIVISSEEVLKRKNQLSSENKAKIFSLLSSRLPEEEIQKISLLMEDGITAGKLKEIEQILQKYLKADEYAQLLNMIQTP
ncbi:hypothetical protein O9H85_35945 [Paenibacillus filicis]|uniref:Spore coat protein n=1 Tax=Paenibacillus gyeongsangnamensis TaxID=3388067 RepID=A0ABT4QL72_9BACL|nr:hypothetical protein [Paenibacillus filicis]MCZ8517624.1 hypothetical protein [Paenibacillus filicis]